MQLRALVGTRSAADFRTNRGKARPGGNTLENERLCAAVDVVNPHGTLIHGLPLAMRFAAAIKDAVREHGAIRARPIGECCRCTHCRRRNQTGCSGKNQATGVANSGERHVSTARRPTRSSVLWTCVPFASPTGCCRMIRTFHLCDVALPTGLPVNLLRAMIGVEPKSVRSS